ncbi:flavo protein-like protein oxygenase [Stipitochalara longipes BDJ]|nr:flavo protein-like protein oxygenase [Stipitochalara longipes BDJ]
MPEAQIEAYDKEALVQRNPHADFAEVEAKRPNYDPSSFWVPTKTPKPSWRPGDGASMNTWQGKPMITIDPYGPGRTPNQNYKLMISTTVPRPIALVSTVSADGKRQNLASFSYFNNVASDPPTYSIAFAGKEAIDTLRNIEEIGELCISVVSDWFLEAANFTSVNTPAHLSEWPLAGLHSLKSSKVRPSHVAESAFSMECKLPSVTPLFSKTKMNEDGSPERANTLVLVEAVMFHAREDAIDGKRETVDIKVLRPVWRGGGITYGTCFGGWETPRPDSFRALRETQPIKDILQTIE